MNFSAAFAQVFRAIASNFALASIIVLAVILYGFYYPAPYAHQTARQLPVVVVDEERTPLTRQLIRNLSDAREVRIAAEAPSVAAAEQMVRAREADGILLLPRGLTRSLLTGARGGGMGLWLNGTYLIRARDIGGAIQAAAVAVGMQRLGPAAEGLHLHPPIEVIERPLFNTREGYADYVFPAVAAVILQQTLLFGSAMLVAGRREERLPPMRTAEYFGTWSGLTLIGCFGAMLYFGWIYWFQDVPRAGNMSGLFVAVPLFAAAVAALGMLLGTLFDRTDRPLQVLIPTSIILFFLAGAAWPLSAMPGWVAALAHVSPATLGAQVFVRLNEMGAPLRELTLPLIGLALLATGYGLAGYVRATRVGRQRPTQSDT